MHKSLLTLMVMLPVIAGCATLTAAEREQKRAELNDMAESVIAGLVEKNPDIKTEVDQSPGFAVANMKLTKIPVVGAGGGEGVFVNKQTGQHTYFTVNRFDLGAHGHIKCY